MSFQVNTQAQLQAEVFSVFPRASPEAITYFSNKVEQWTNNLCDFPYWFLRLSASSTFQSNFPLPSGDPTLLPLIIGNWVAKGWLRITPGVNRYQIFQPLEDDYASDPTWWAASRVKNIGYCKEFTSNGNLRYDLEYTSSDLSLSTTYVSSKNGPYKVSLETTESGSFLIFHPTPTQINLSKLYAVQCILSQVPWYQSPSDAAIRNRFLTYAPDAVLYKCLIEIARFFDEKTMAAEFKEELYGTPAKGEARGAFPYKGIMGKYWEQTRDMARQNEKTIPWYGSSAQAVGRGTLGGRFGSHWGMPGYFRFYT